MKNEMTSRERVIAAIDFKGPDKVPMFLNGISWDEMKKPGFADNSVNLPNDYIHDNIGWYKEGDLLGRNVDNWGCEWLNLREGNLGQVVKHPLDDIEKLASYKWPSAKDMDMATANEMSEKRDDKYFMLGYISLFERMINLRGFENLLMDIALEEDHFFIIRDKILEYNMELIEMALALNPDALFLADDWGSQISLLINPDAWRKLYLPAYEKMFARIHKAGKHVFFHSDGYVINIMPDLIKAGADVFWIEFGVNKLEALKKDFAGKVSFLALLDTQVIEFGTFEEIDEHIKELIGTLGSFNGGFISRYDYDDSEKCKVIVNAFKKYGGY